jgi:Xaa-Pro aminopeptidase
LRDTVPFKVFRSLAAKTGPKSVPSGRYTFIMRPLVALLLCVPPLFAAGIAPDEYKSRRAELRKSLDGVMILFGAEESEDLHNAFFQESNFLYLSGWREPGAVMMLTRSEEIFFLPPRNAQGENFTGRKTLPEDREAPERTGFARVLPREAIETNYLRLLESSRHIYAVPGDLRAQKLRSLGALHEERNAAQEIARLRVIKSPAEIALIAQATDATVAAHLASWKRMKPGLFEYEIAATMTNAYFERGCERSAYAPIVASGPESVVLHYMTNHRRVDSGEMVLMDVGAECAGYATDVTRTVPANGKFTARQREIYEIVLGAQKAAIAAVKPGARLRGEGDSLQKIAHDYIDSHGKDRHGDSLGKYFTHGLSHFVGLDVHDPGDTNQPLKAGMIITIEPGIYIPEENIGVRIEDTLLVTEDGARVLSAALPREAGEIEKRIGK